MTTPDDEIIIIGAGCFGTSTAYHLLKRGFTKITVLDRSDVLPAPDAASNDFNRIVRSSYSDPFYAKLAREAIECWKDREQWGDTYHESGVLVLGFSDEAAYADDAYRNDLALGARLVRLSGGAAIRSTFPSQASTALFDGVAGFLNCDGGWANAGQGVSIMIRNIVALGGKVIPGKRVCKVACGVGTDDAIRRVECDDGTFYDASLVVIATGSWTSSAFLHLASQYTSGLATGQCITMIQLTEREAEAYKDCPVVLDFGTSGFYVFPPNEHGIVKMATHVAGYVHRDITNGNTSTPRTVVNDPERGLLIPTFDLQRMRIFLRQVYPALAEKPFSATRLCWYNDTPDGNWLIGRHPADPSLVLATGDSGHAYKFLPVIGRLIADAIQGTLEPSIVAKFAVDRRYVAGDPSRKGMSHAELSLDQLCTPEDLLP